MMIVTENTAAVLPVSKESTRREQVTPSTSQDPAGTTISPGAQGIQRLSSDAAAVVLTEQASAANGTPTDAATPAPTPRLDLHGQDLRAVDLSKLDLRGADLSGVDLTGKDLTGIDLSGATLTGAKLDGATFSQSNLHGVNAKGASFTKATFDHTDLDDGNFAEAAFNGAVFGFNGEDPSRMTGKDHMKFYSLTKVNFDGADFSNSEFQQNTIAESCSLNGAKFDGSKVMELNVVSGSMKSASFQHMAGSVICCNTDVSNGDFRNIDGGSVYLGMSKVDGVTFAGSKLRRLACVGVDLTFVDLSVKDKDLRNSRFSNTIMTGKDFSGYDFSGSDFECTGSIVGGPYVQGEAAKSTNMVAGTDFRGAKFTGANFYNFDMRAALLDAGAFRGTTVSNWLDITVHVDSDNYDINSLFKNIWPELARRMQSR